MSSSPRKAPASRTIVAGGAVLLLVAIVIGILLSPAGDALYPPPDVTAQGSAIRELYNIIFAIAVVIFLVVEGLIVWSILRYRRRPEDVDLPPQTHGNNLVEALWTLIPTALVLYMFAISWQTLDYVDAVSPEPDVRIHVLAGQFQWQFEYLDQNGNKLATQTRPTGDEGGMAVPVGRNVYVTLDSADVIHAWYVPRFLFKRDVVPGQTNHFEFRVDEAEAGQRFTGQCAELCGTGHRIMLFDVIAMTPTDYDAWLAQLVEQANATPPPAPSGAPELEIVAEDIAFDKLELTLEADVPFVINFQNNDPAGVPHDIDLRQSDGTTVIKDQTEIPGGETTQYTYDPLAAGTYTYICSIHPIPAMTGTPTVQ
jgi:cytochrome c oxidase subunit II